ncbi:MAG: betaine--homocysteine S-methyltransferase [Anaerolineales bacterium]|nr:betaine--homocysteine S-methyltransferase [Anaerolineales bacterium]
MNKLFTLLQSGKPILLDGAMGTMLFAAGLESGESPEEWNVLHPEKVREIHRAYIEAGSQVILTNTFGGSSVRLKNHGLAERVHELNEAGAKNARAEADSVEQNVVVAGSIGPTGQLLKPLGRLTKEAARQSFAAQAGGLVAGGVDMFWIETMSDLEEVKAAIAGVRSVSNLPIAATMSFDSHGHTMMGTKPEQAAEALQKEDIQFLGANCGTGSNELIEAIKAFKSTNPELPLIAKANAGIPIVVGTEVVYNGSPEVMADYAVTVWSEGARLIGGCCGSTPEHIKAMAEALAEFS